MGQLTSSTRRHKSLEPLVSQSASSAASALASHTAPALPYTLTVSWIFLQRRNGHPSLHPPPVFRIHTLVGSGPGHPVTPSCVTCHAWYDGLWPNSHPTNGLVGDTLAACHFRDTSRWPAIRDCASHDDSEAQGSGCRALTSGHATKWKTELLCEINGALTMHDVSSCGRCEIASYGQSDNRWREGGQVVAPQPLRPATNRKAACFARHNPLILWLTLSRTVNNVRSIVHAAERHTERHT